MTGKRKGQGRHYYIDEDLPRARSVTTYTGVINKPALVPWAAKKERELVMSAVGTVVRRVDGINAADFLAEVETAIGKEKASERALREAGDTGSLVHARIEYELRKALGVNPGAEPKSNEKVLAAFAAWERWAKKGNLKPRWVEHVLFSRKHNYAGTVDLVGWYEGIYTMPDWKTSSGIYPEYKIQLSAYAKALEEMGHDPVERAMIVHIPTDGTSEVDTVSMGRDEIEDAFARFLEAKNLFEWLGKQNGGWQWQ